MNSDAIARDLLRRGFQPVRLKPRSKMPPTDGWQRLRYTEATISRVFANGCNVGILLGEPSDNTVDLDVDHPRGAAALQALGAPATLTYHHAGRPHLLFRCEPVPATTKWQGIHSGKLVTFMEVRSTGAQSVAPGSIHPDDGLPYEWSNAIARADWSPWDVCNLARDLATVCLLTDHWAAPVPGEHGARHQLALAVAGFLARRTDAETVYAVIEAAARVMEDREIEDRRRAVEDTLQKVSHGMAVVGLPTLAALIGEEDARTLHKWWPDQRSPLELVPDKDSAMLDATMPPALALEWRVYPAPEFLSLPFAPVAWRIEAWLREQAIALWFGAPGTIKTFLATDAALAVATGGLFLGTFSAQPGKVLIVQEDTVDSDYQQAYLRPLVEARGLTPADLDRLYIAPAAGLHLDEGAWLQRVTDWLEAEYPQLVVLDAFYLLHQGEGYGKEMRALIGILRRLRTQYGTALWIVDHDRKGGRDADEGNPIDRLFGGREKSAGADVIVEVQNVKGQDGVVQIHCHKLRGAKKPPALTVSLVAGRLLAEGLETKAPPDLADALYQWLCREGGSRTKAQMEHGTALSKRTVGYGLADLFRRGLVRKAGTAGRADTWLALSEPGDVPW